MTTSTPTSHQDLHKRTVTFARTARQFVSKTPRTIASLGDCRRLIHVSGSIGSTYLEADGAPSRAVFLRAIRQCCREARQARHWLELLDDNLEERSESLRTQLAQEALELERIFGSIASKVSAKPVPKEAKPASAPRTMAVA